MFAAIARFDIRFRWLIVAVWLVGVVAGARLLPGLTTVTHAGNGQFNSSSSPSVSRTGPGRLPSHAKARANPSDARSVAFRGSSGLDGSRDTGDDVAGRLPPCATKCA